VPPIPQQLEGNSLSIRPAFAGSSFLVLPSPQML
jgi:hypothetical protein